MGLRDSIFRFANIGLTPSKFTFGRLLEDELWKKSLITGEEGRTLKESPFFSNIIWLLSEALISCKVHTVRQNK
jgi:hypothetical protein